VNGIQAVLPSFTERRAETTVQLYDGQSFMIAGLIKSNATGSIKRFPGLGDIPILGTLFRSSQFQREKSELMFVITPRLVKPLPEKYPLPTDSFIEPSRNDYFIKGKLEGSGSSQQREGSNTKGASPSKQAGGFEMNKE
jgi:pilus assembly protein CpaC